MNDELNFKKNWDKYFLVYFLIGTTGMNFYYKNIEFIFIFFFITLSIFVLKKKRIDRFILPYFLLFFAIQMGQSVKFSFLPLITYLGLYLRLLYAYFTLKLVGKRFTEYYVNILYFFSLISFTFYFTSLLFPGIMYFFINNLVPYLRSPFYDPEAYYGGAPHIIIFNFGAMKGGPFYNIGRNSGPFWEPGAFGGFLLLALIFNLIHNKSIFDKKNRVFILALITTFSTAAYIALAVLLIFYFISQKKKVKNVIIIPIIILISIYAYYKLDFMETKISYHIEISKNANITYGSRTRFVSAKLDFEDLKNSPVFGVGRRIETRQAGIIDPRLRHRNNGLSSLLAVYGPVIFIIYFYLIFKSLIHLCIRYNFKKNFAFYALVIVFVIGFSEPYFLKPLFYSMTMLHLTVLVRDSKFIKRRYQSYF